MAGDTRGPAPGDANGREARLGAALRENLRRRKAQARGRAEAAKTTTPEAEPGRDQTT